MAWNEVNWETSKGVKVARLCGKPGPDHKDHWPRVVILDLSAKQFEKFKDNPLKFAQEQNLYPEQPILWMPCCCMPPVGQGIPQPAPGTRWAVIFLHGKVSTATCAAIPCDFLPLDDDDPETS